MIARRIAPLNLDTVQDLPLPCRTCVFWELDPVTARATQRCGGGADAKQAWLSGALLQWGSVGRVAYVESSPAGYLMYAPPPLVPRATAFATAPISADAVLLMTGRVLPAFGGFGLGRMLMQAAAKDLTQRGVRAIEAFGKHGATGDGTEAAQAAESAGPTGACLLPVDYLLAVGFTTVRPHHLQPRLRLDLRTALSWREDVEHALERLFGSVRTPILTRG